MLSKKHYKAIAEIVGSLTVPRFDYPHDPILYRGELVRHLAAYCFEDNPRFDRERFITACESSVDSAELWHQTRTTTR